MDTDTVLQHEAEAPNQAEERAESSLARQALLCGGRLGPLWQQEQGWQLILADHHRRCFMSYKPSVFSGIVSETWYSQCAKSLPWERPWVKEKRLPRKACWLTMPDVPLPYRYGGREWPCHAMPAWFQVLTAQVCAACGIKDPPNSCNANMYESGDDMVGWHADNEPLFKADKQDALIISLSLGASRTFAYRLNAQPDKVKDLRLHDGDLFTMEGLTQKYYKHAVRKERRDVLPRINLTWRWIVR